MIGCSKKKKEKKRKKEKKKKCFRTKEQRKQDQKFNPGLLLIGI